MANYRNISVGFWTDPKVDDDFTPEDKYFYLYLLTNPHTNICGCYEISKKQIERETGYNWDTISRLITRMQESHKVIRFNESAKEVLIINWGKYNWTKSDKVKLAVASVATHIKTREFKDFVLNAIETWDFDYSREQKQKQITDTETDTETDTDVSIRYGYPMDTVSDKPKRKRFVRPSLEEIKDYCFEKCISIDAEQFFDYYEANGWKVGKNPMKDWKASVRNWARRDRDDKHSKKNDVEEWLELGERYEQERSCQADGDYTSVFSEL